MQTFKIKDDQLEQAAKQLKQANATLAEAKKTADKAKEVIANRLAILRGLTVEALPVGEVVSINGGEILIEIGKQNRFDEAKFQVEHPQLYFPYKKDFACIKYKVNM